MFIKHLLYSTWLRVTQQIWLINMIYGLLIGSWSSSLLSRLAGETVDAPSITPWHHHFYACWSDGGFQWKHLELFAWGLPWSTYIAGHKCQGVNTPHSHPEEQPSTMADGRRWLRIPIFLPLVRINPRYVLYCIPELPSEIVCLGNSSDKARFLSSLPHLTSLLPYKGILASPPNTHQYTNLESPSDSREINLKQYYS